jgi:Glutamine amidotransferase class-I
MKYRDQMATKGFVISGTSPDGTLAELIELRDHPYFVGCQYHPEFQSKPNKPHPLFKGFIEACLTFAENGSSSRTAPSEHSRTASSRSDEVNRPCLTPVEAGR